MKFTRDDYFNAASAHDLWGSINIGVTYQDNGTLTDCCAECEAKLSCYSELLHEAEDWFGTGVAKFPIADSAFLMAQLGLEKIDL